MECGCSKLKEVVKLLITVLIAGTVNLFVVTSFVNDTNIDLKSINLLDYNKESETIKIEVTKKLSVFYKFNFTCNAYNNGTTISERGRGQKCILEIPSDGDYKIYLENKYGNSKSYNLIEHIDNKLEFNFEKEEAYLAVGDKMSIKYSDKYIFPIDKLYSFYSSDASIAIVNDGKIEGVAPGVAYIKEKSSDDSIKVTVTDLISPYTLSKEKKEIVPCNNYTEDEAKLLDNLLEYYVNEAGFGTRAGAVAAGRFLTLQFKYRVPYFYENGRINDSGVHLADGEGRYYKQGLYLSESKYADIRYTYADKAMWGCPLKNGTNNRKYGFVAGNKMPNGLDCSGFVSWALVNGGFDPGDVGAGENEGIYQLTDTGEFTTLTRDLALSGKIKTGDLFNFWGHIALIIGQDEDNYYVAESLPHLGGVIAKTYPKKTVANTFEFVVFMDKFYKEDGNLIDYWN